MRRWNMPHKIVEKIENAVAAYIKTNLSFSFNCAQTRGVFRATFTCMLAYMVQTGEIRDNFKVICDDTNNPPYVIDANLFNYNIHFQIPSEDPRLWHNVFNRAVFSLAYDRMFNHGCGKEGHTSDCECHTLTK
jgi:hypothetical protein